MLSMLCYAIRCVAKLCYVNRVMLCYAIYAMLSYVILCYVMICYAVLCHLCYVELSVLCYSLRWVAIVSYLAHESRQLGDEARGRVVRIEEGLAARHHQLGTTPEREREGGEG